jgi:hemerythrin
MNISWNNSMSVCNDALDNDHQNLIRIFNNLDECFESPTDKDTLRLELVELEKCMKLHFAREEVILSKVNYPNKHEHFEKHHDLKRQLKAFITLLPFINEHNKDIPPEGNFINILRQWLTDHVLNEDLKIKPYLSQFPRDFA